MVSENIITIKRHLGICLLLFPINTQKFQNTCTVHEQKTMLMDFL